MGMEGVRQGAVTHTMLPQPTLSYSTLPLLATSAKQTGGMPLTKASQHSIHYDPPEIVSRKLQTGLFSNRSIFSLIYLLFCTPKSKLTWGGQNMMGNNCKEAVQMARHTCSF